MTNVRVTSGTAVNSGYTSYSPNTTFVLGANGESTWMTVVPTSTSITVHMLSAVTSKVQLVVYQ